MYCLRGTADAPELLALAAQGKLTVRALRGFGQLDVRYDATALTLRKRGLNLYAADARQIAAWTSASGGPLKDLPDATLTAFAASTPSGSTVSLGIQRTSSL